MIIYSVHAWLDNRLNEYYSEFFPDFDSAWAFYRGKTNDGRFRRAAIAGHEIENEAGAMATLLNRINWHGGLGLLTDRSSVIHDRWTKDD